MDEQLLIIKIVQRENESGCFDIIIGGIPIHSCIAESLRMSFLKSQGFGQMVNRQGANSADVIKTFFNSCYHLVKLLLSHRRYENLIYSFARVDKVGESYMDKFTDPVIELSDIKDNYIIFERSRGGKHSKPRAHSGNVVYSDSIDIILDIYARIFCGSYKKKHKNEFVEYFKCIKDVYGEENINEQFLSHDIYFRILKIRFYKWLFKKLGIKRLFSVSRNFFLTLLYSAKSSGIPVYEFQHGITYAETTEYSGYRHPMFTPDKFLAFGDNEPKDVYGIDEKDIVEIGWAFGSYIENVKVEELEDVREDDILVISDPTVTSQIIDATITLANSSPHLKFYIRCHPMELLTQEHVDKLEKYKNIHIQDRTINIAVVMKYFTNVIGESSTVLYEALSANKKVGKLFMSGMKPRYLKEEDSACFWKITGINDFKEFVNGKSDEKVSKSIYSEFKKEKVNALLA